MDDSRRRYLRAFFALASAAFVGSTTLGVYLLGHSGAAPPLPPFTANIYVSANGSDVGVNCVRSAALIADPDPGGTTVCKTWSKAYSLALAGDTVGVDGSHGNFTSQAWSGTKAGDPGCNGNDGGVTSGCVTFTPVSGTPTIDGTTGVTVNAITVRGLGLLADYVQVKGAFHIIKGGAEISSATCPAVGTITPVASTTGGTLATGTYFYRVTATVGGVETLASPEPAGVSVTGPTGSVALTWTAVASATSYTIYRGTASKAENVFYTSATNSFTDTGAANTGGTSPTQMILAHDDILDGLTIDSTSATTQFGVTIQGGVVNPVLRNSDISQVTNNSTYNGPCTGIDASHPYPMNELIDHNTYHDFHFATSGVHMQAIQDYSTGNATGATYGLIIRRNTFYAIGQTDIYIHKDVSAGTVGGVQSMGRASFLIENNSLGIVLGLSDTLTPASGQVGTLVFAPLVSPAVAVVRFNSLDNDNVDPLLSCDACSTSGATFASGSLLYGNIFDSTFSAFNCSFWQTTHTMPFSYNVWLTGTPACGTGSVAVADTSWIASDSATSGENLRLSNCTNPAAGLVSTGVTGGVPTTDLELIPRPKGGGTVVDAGAYETCR